MDDKEKEEFRNIKSHFFALRNGEIADRLRKSGSPYKIIFGLIQPQIEEVAATVRHTNELAQRLWANDSTRESRLLATMVFPVEEFTEDLALEWALSAETTELVDQLCFRLVRYLPGAERLAFSSVDNGDSRMHYFGFRLLMNLLVLRRLSDVDSAYTAARQGLVAPTDACVQRVCRQIVDEIEWLRESCRAE